MFVSLRLLDHRLLTSHSAFFAPPTNNVSFTTVVRNQTKHPGIARDPAKDAHLKLPNASASNVEKKTRLAGDGLEGLDVSRSSSYLLPIA